ncbi:MAG: hypothetical protein J6R82_07625 [Clostridia bacterium]|nr:hypothetical protein [Clostridia bacterium]
MKKITALWIAVLCLTSLIGCTDSASFEPLHDSSEIEAIYIVETVMYDPEAQEWTLETIGEVTEIQAFVTELTALKTTFVNPPATLTAGMTMIKIEYANGDYELIGSMVQRDYRPDGTGGGSQNVFDAAEYNTLIQRYMKSVTDQ